MDTATPGEIFVPRKPSGTYTRMVTDGRVTCEVRIIGNLGPNLEVFDIQNGGHGEIYFCVRAGGTDPRLAVVCKRFPRQVLLDPVRRRAFMRECLLAVRMTGLPGFASSHILRIDGIPVLVTKAVLRGDDGVVNLRDVIEGPPPAVPVVGFVAWAIAECMAAAGAIHPDFVHGDLKPENILIQAGAPLITDLGLASTLQYGWGPDTLPGTPRYLAPEARGPEARLTLATDIYAFGVMLREILDNSPTAEASPHAPAFNLIVELALQCTADDPQRRPTGFSEIALHLRQTFDGSDPAVEQRYLVHQLLSSLNVSMSVTFPNLESLARLEEWDLILEKIEAQHPDERHTSTWQMHGLALTRTGRDNEALESFFTALARAEWEIENKGKPWIYGPDEDAISSIKFDIAVLLVNLKQYREAEELARELVASANSDDAARHAKGIVAQALINSGNLITGEQMLITSMTREQDNERLAERFRTLSLLRLRQGRPAEAIEAMQRAVQLTPGRASHHRRLGELLAHLDQPSLAVTAFDHAMQCGDLTLPVLEMRLACEIFADDRVPDDYRSEAERQFGAERVTEAWQGVLDIIANAQELEPAEDAVSTGDSPLGQTFNYGELQVAVDHAGFYTFDYYTDSDEPDLVGKFTARYREMATMTTWATMRGAPIVCTQCSGCRTAILTNRPVGATFTCVRCDAGNAVSPMVDDLHRDLCGAVNQALDMVDVPADGQGRYVVLQPWEPGTEEQAERVHEAARRHGLEPVPSYHPAVLYAYARGMAGGTFAIQHDPIGAIYRFPEGSRHIPRMTPLPVEEYLAEVRSIFECPVNSSSDHLDYTGEDLNALIWTDRLDQAVELVRSNSDLESRPAALILLSRLRLYRGQSDLALQLADEAVRLDATDENAWVAKGFAELAHGDITSAGDSAHQALRINAASSDAIGLQANIEQFSGDAKAQLALARAITLGAIFAPPDGL